MSLVSKDMYRTLHWVAYNEYQIELFEAMPTKHLKC